MHRSQGKEERNPRLVPIEEGRGRTSEETGESRLDRAFECLEVGRIDEAAALLVALTDRLDQVGARAYGGSDLDPTRIAALLRRIEAVSSRCEELRAEALAELGIVRVRRQYHAHTRLGEVETPWFSDRA